MAKLSQTLVRTVSRWLKQSSLQGAHLDTIIGGCCDRLGAAGIPIARAHFSFSMLHPLYGALNFTWQRAKALEQLQMEPGARQSDGFSKSPYFHLLHHGLEHVRLRIDAVDSSEFPIVADLRAHKMTDYFAFMQGLGEDPGRAMFGSWATGAETGFTDEMIEALVEIQTDLAVAAKMAISKRLTQNMLTTYLGEDAGKRSWRDKSDEGTGTPYGPCWRWSTCVNRHSWLKARDDRAT